MSGFLLDTNIVSEVRRASRANTGVMRWYEERDGDELFLSVITLGEIQRGIALLARRDPAQAGIMKAWAVALQNGFAKAGRLLPVHAEEALIWAELQAIRPLPVLDCFLAATAKVHDLTLVTRNTPDFSGLPIRVLNPFT